MSLTANELYLGNSGFGLFLGAGASFEAGYPLITKLTSAILQNLNTPQFELVSNLVEEELGCTLDVEAGYPNIEMISDLLASCSIQLGAIHGEEYHKAALHIRNEIVRVLQTVENPDLTQHIRLLEAFRRIKEGTTSPLWIFTTNYDLLIERAAAEAGIPLYDGFIGGALRYFQPSSLSWCHGTVLNQYGRPQFELRTGPYINLIKLHGSIDWWINNKDNERQKVYSCLDHSLIRSNITRAMITPQRSKVHDVLGLPYDQLWGVASSVLGKQCKYLLSCGYSFGDEHINKKLFLPRLVDGRLKIFALLSDETEGLSALSHFTSLTYCTKDTRCDGGAKVVAESDLWKFSSLVNLIASYAGI